MILRSSAREVALYDIDASRADAEVLVLAHGTLFTGASSITGGGDLDVVDGSNVVVITAGAKQRPGQTRLELAGVNVRIIRDLMPQLVRRAPRAERRVRDRLEPVRRARGGGPSLLGAHAIGLSGARIVEAVLRDEGAVLPVSTVLDNYHGISGVAHSVQCVVDARGVSRVIEVPFSSEEQAKFAASAETMRRSLHTLGLS